MKKLISSGFAAKKSTREKTAKSWESADGKGPKSPRGIAGSANVTPHRRTPKK